MEDQAVMVRGVASLEVADSNELNAQTAGVQVVNQGKETV